MGAYLAWKANTIITQQNELITIQNYLTEANRRSSLVFLFSNIQDKLSEEFEHQETRELSPPLIGRIVALSRSLKPYYYLYSDTLTDLQASPERGQLLLWLIQAQVDTLSLLTIFKGADFSYSELSGANLDGAFLKGIKMDHSILTKASLKNANLKNSNLTECEMSQAVLSHSSMQFADLSYSDLSSAMIDTADLRHSQFISADLSDASLVGADVTGIDLFIRGDQTLFLVELDGVTVADSTWFETIDQDIHELKMLKTLYRVESLDYVGDKNGTIHKLAKPLGRIYATADGKRWLHSQEGVLKGHRVRQR